MVLILLTISPLLYHFLFTYYYSVSSYKRSFMGNRHEHHLELYGTSGINIPYLNNNTSGRLTMSEGQDNQVPVIENPEEALVDTGFSAQMNNFTFDITVENTSIFLGVVKKFNNTD